MNTREQFGNYLLLKKLSEDQLGETFRAGMLSAKGMERVVLLRVFNGQGIDGERLWQACRERAEIQRALRSPNIGEGIEMGEVQGIPYVAYDYVSGKNLAALIEQAGAMSSPIPTEHALLITERVALALALASEHRFGGERILHGFLVPHLVMISNEGESRLLGFEVAPALRLFATNPVMRQHFGRYLSPEALAGAPPDRTDDIYSLGVLLYELLTGTSLPPPAADGYGTTIDQAVLATEGKAPLPAELRQLLRQSLVAREQRLGDVVAWHKTLNKWMFEGRYNPTTFNLAFFMHNLFRQEIERESQEIEVEKTMPLPVTAPASGPAPTQPPASGPAPASGTVATPTSGAVAAAPPKSSKTGLMIGLAAVLLAAVGGGLWYVLRPAAGGATPPAVAAQSPLPPPATPTEIDPEPTDALEDLGEAPSEEEQAALQAKIDELVAQRTSELESALRAKVDEQLQTLRRQLAAAEKAAAERERLLRERRAEEARRQQEAEAEAERQRLAAEEKARKQKEAEAEAARLAEENRRRQEAEAAKKAAPPPPPPPPPPPAVRRGDLVEPGPGVVNPQRVRLPPAHFPEMARRLGKSGVEVVVRVLVDENGKVIEAELVGDKVGFGFDAEALSVARGAIYKPATVNGVPVKMWVNLRVKFQ